MSRTISLLCALTIGAIAPFTLHPGPAAGAPVAGDLDGDLTGGAADCAPLNPSVHPGAADRPDLAFTDTNCDGIDGDIAKAVFVSSTAPNDDGSGTRANPKKLITSGIALAAASGKNVYVTGGTFTGTLALADDISVYGGYTPDFANRSEAETTTVNGINGPAALAAGDTGVVLQLLTLHGVPDALGAGSSSYGLRAINDGPVASQVVLEHVAATAAPAPAGSNGTGGSTGSTGTGFLGGPGGAGGCGDGVPGALGSFGGNGGQLGAPGTNGANGTTAVVPSGPTWVRQQSLNGTSGGPGGGGRGGQGGFGASWVFGILCGGLGGFGGTGGGPGGGGLGGHAGGGSFGVYAFNSSVVAVGSTLTGGAGGAGGNGGSGGFGGSGGLGGSGLAGQCGFNCAFGGLQGQQGAPGGRGGGGGGGVGGPSAAVYQAGLTSGFTRVDTDLDFADVTALGGMQGNTGLRAASGQTVSILRSPQAPLTSTYDFDGDSVADPVDACPTDHGGADANGDGCPEAPNTTIASGPAANGYLLNTQTSIGLGSSESGTFACSLDGAAADTCTSPHGLSGLAARTHVFKAWATDGDALADPTAATRTFTVPVNNTALTHSSGWTKKTGSGYFRSTYSTSTRQGATLSEPVTNALRIALVATKAPGQGKVNVMLGRTLLRQVNLSSTTTRKKQVFESTLPAARSGTIKLVVATSGKPVRIEGLGVVTQ